MFICMNNAPKDENLLLLCVCHNGLLITEGFWEVNKHAGSNPWNTERGYWKPFTGNERVRTSETLDPVGWMSLPKKCLE